MENLFETLGSILNPNEPKPSINFDDYFDDDDDYCGDDDDDWFERKQEELQERASYCTCGAWQMSKTGEVFHVADCCCGAE